MKRIGILGGTFDPVHNGHLRAAMEMHEGLGLDHVRLIPCAQPPHRSSPVLSARERLRLLRLAVAEQPGLQVDERELTMEGPSWTVNTLASLRADFADRALCLAVGADALLGFHTWHRWQEIVGLCHLIVLRRPGWQLGDKLSALDAGVREWVQDRRVTDPAQLDNEAAGRCFFLSIPALDISASAIRERLAQGRSPRWLVPDKVLDEIIRLYS